MKHGEPAAQERPAAARPREALLFALGQLSDVLDAATDGQYVRNPVGVIPSSLGGHVRHCLDHFETLVDGASCGLIDYDRRERGTAVESNRRAALDAIERTARGLDALTEEALTRRIRVRSMLDGQGAAIETESSLGREMVFVLSHTIHHCALIAAMCRTLGIAVPEGFGYAPSTLAHLDRSSCVPSRLSR